MDHSKHVKDNKSSCLYDSASWKQDKDRALHLHKMTRQDSQEGAMVLSDDWNQDDDYGGDRSLRLEAASSRLTCLHRIQDFSTYKTSIIFLVLLTADIMTEFYI